MNHTEIVPLHQFSPNRLSADPEPEDDAKQVTTEKRKLRILVVDDEPLIANTIVDILNGSGFEAMAVYDGKAGVEQARQLCPEAVVSDVIMPRLNGIDMAISIKNNCPKTRILLLSGQAGTADLMEAARKKGHNFELLSKPLKPDVLLKKLSQ